MTAFTPHPNHPDDARSLRRETLAQGDTAAALRSEFVDAVLDTNERFAAQLAAANATAAAAASFGVIGAVSADPEAPVPCTTSTFPNAGVLAMPHVPRAVSKAVAETLLQLGGSAATALRMTFDTPEQYWPVFRLSQTAGPLTYRTCSLSDSAADVYGSIICPDRYYKKART